jgi:hypothetical protein
MCFILFFDMDVAITPSRRSATMIVVVVVWCLLWFRCQRQNPCSIMYGPMLGRDIHQQNNLQFIFESDDRHWVNLLRMRWAPFFQLCDLFRARGLLWDNINSTIEEQVAMFLPVVGHNQRFRVILCQFLLIVILCCKLM